MSAITGIGDSTTIVFRASTSLSRGTATRTMSAPASATRRIWSMVAWRLAVSVLVIVWTATGAPPPMGTPRAAARGGARRHARFFALTGVEADSRIVDIGCGALGLRALEPGRDITGVDLVPRPQYPGPFVHADVLAGL